MTDTENVQLVGSFAPAAPTRVYSIYQKAIFAAFCQGQGNLLVEAVAGSGKTTTLVEALRRWQVVPANRRAQALFCAFNKSIADELRSRVPAGVQAKTLHGLCFGAVSRAFPGVRVDDRKLHSAAGAVAVAALGEHTKETINGVAADLVKVYGLLRGTMTDLANNDAVVETLSAYGALVDFPVFSLPLLPELDLTMKSETSSCTFDEMLTFVLDHSLSLPRYDLICVDESQDLNRLQIELLERALAPGGRLVAVGDSRQAIYLFRGSDAQAMTFLREKFNIPDENCLPLSITYRCPKAVVELAQSWVERIQASASAPEGQVLRRQAKECGGTLMGLASGSMVICRVNAPLVSQALRLIAGGKKAIVRGRDIGKTITKLAAKLSKRLRDNQVRELSENCRAYRDLETAKLMAARKDASAQQLDDQCETLFALLKGVATISGLQARIENLFSDNKVGVVFSSIHRSKGLEAATVVWLGPEKNDQMEERARNEAGRQAENNLRYVATTRAMDTLIIQPLPEKEDEDE